ncbi:cohesin domain-containing protein [Mycetocola sp. JXN-3]|uniref:cohesin domain-containing protein n=1 Tax=Mycetocola sp. JXN-3 TaxID=2116510 RepID=UPI00165CF882|nr:cohesin domain-containing protein [Mycetocola sp. JXN-3]
MPIPVPKTRPQPDIAATGTASGSPRIRRIRASLLIGALTLAGALGLAGPAVAAPASPTVTITAPESVTAGDTATVTLHLTGVSDTFALQATLAADPTLLRYTESSVSGPEGGFTSATPSATGIDIVHTRLGGSPALNGEITLSLTLTATGSGSTTLALTALTLVDGAGASTAGTSLPQTAIRVIAAEPTASPSPGTSADPGPGASPTPSTSASTVPSSTVSPTAGAGSAGGLPGTGATIGLSLLGALAALGAGLVLLRIRKAVRR